MEEWKWPGQENEEYWRGVDGKWGRKGGGKDEALGFPPGFKHGSSVLIRFKLELWVFDFIWHLSIVHKKPPNFSLALPSSMLPHTHLSPTCSGSPEVAHLSLGLLGFSVCWLGFCMNWGVRRRWKAVRKVQSGSFFLPSWRMFSYLFIFIEQEMSQRIQLTYTIKNAVCHMLKFWRWGELLAMFQRTE